MRDFDKEFKETSTKYFYGFDLMMHNYTIETFRPFVVPGKSLELGSYKGEFTKKLMTLSAIDSMDCVEGSAEAIAQSPVLPNVKYINGLFETVTLDSKYDNVFMTHVLEHLDDPVAVLSRVKEEWLLPNGRLFIEVPNANAPSRQIAVEMGLIPLTTAVTPAEKEHGHTRTYNLETLRIDAIKAGLKVVHSGGVFFKALANFQWDKAVEANVVSQQYLDASYQLGKRYPDLCSSIYLVCEK